MVLLYRKRSRSVDKLIMCWGNGERATSTYQTRFGMAAVSVNMQQTKFPWRPSVVVALRQTPAYVKVTHRLLLFAMRSSNNSVWSVHSLIIIIIIILVEYWCCLCMISAVFLCDNNHLPPCTIPWISTAYHSCWQTWPNHGHLRRLTVGNRNKKFVSRPTGKAHQLVGQAKCRTTQIQPISARYRLCFLTSINTDRK